MSKSIKRIVVETDRGKQRVWAVCDGQVAIHHKVTGGGEDWGYFTVSHVRSGFSLVAGIPRQDARVVFAEVCSLDIDWDAVLAGTGELVRAKLGLIAIAQQLEELSHSRYTGVI